MLNNVAVPDILAARHRECCLDARNLVGIGNDHVLDSLFPWFRGNYRAVTCRFLCKFIHDDILAVHDLECHVVRMNGMGIVRAVVDFPDFGGT